MAGPKKVAACLHEGNSKLPVSEFNRRVLAWLRDEIKVKDHAPAAAFSPVRALVDAEISALTSGGHSASSAYRHLLSRLTPMLLGVDLSSLLGARLAGELINTTGFRSTLSQGQAKNNGENFVNAIVYVLAELLKHQDDVLVDKGTPPCLKDSLTLTRRIRIGGEERVLRVPIECDFAVFSRSDPTKAIVVSAKTRLKEVFHVGTMWKLFFDIAGDAHCEAKWGLTSSGTTTHIDYCFATADMIPSTGRKTQGPDVERDIPRNLIAMDASFFKYVFVSKTGIGHVSTELDYGGEREALFHELGCLIDMIEQKFGIQLS